MNNNKKAILMVLCSVMLVAASLFGTLAYLTDTAEATYTFTVGNIDITLDEAEVDLYGAPVESAERVSANQYKLIPGHTYTKDPTVTVKAGSEEAYIRMIVTVNNKAALDKIGVDIVKMFVGYKSEMWTLIESRDDTADTRTYEFRYFQTVNALEVDVKLDPLFKEMVIPGDVTLGQLGTLKELTIHIAAHAIQADGFESADAAWAAFSTKSGE